MTSKIEFSNLTNLKDVESLMLEMNLLTRSKLKKRMKKTQRQKFIKFKDRISLEIDVVNNGKIAPEFKSHLFPKVLCDTDSFLILHKPIQVHNYPLDYSDSNNVLSFLRSKHLLKFDTYSFEDFGLLNRLDYETSGLLFYSKLNSTKEEIFLNRDSYFTEKKYLCIVHGKTLESFERVDDLKAYSTKQSLVRVDPTGEEVKITGTTLEYNSKEDLSLIEVELFKGYKHQIRVQLMNMGHALLGDPLYSESEVEVKRMYLHHVSATLKWKSNQETFKDENYDDFKRIFPSLK